MLGDENLVVAEDVAVDEEVVANGGVVVVKETMIDVEAWGDLSYVRS